MKDKEKYDFIDHVVHLALFEEDRLLNEHGGDYSGLEEDGIDSNEYYRIITERVINTLKKNNNYMQEEPVSEDLKKAAVEAFKKIVDSDKNSFLEIFKAGAKWNKEHLWKPADSNDLPEIDKDVIVLTQPYPLDGTEYVVSFAHRPYKGKYIYKNLTTGNIETFENETYDEGGWNIPDVKWWLDVDLPKEIEL